MKIEIYNTNNTFELKDSLEIVPENFEKFQKLISSLSWGDYARKHYQPYVVDKEKAMDMKLDLIAISRILDDVETKDFFDNLLTANNAQDIKNFLQYYINMER